MGMISSIDEEEVARMHSAEREYAKRYPWRVPKQGADEMTWAFYYEEVRKWAARPPTE